MATAEKVDTRWFQDRLADKRLSQRRLAARLGLDPAAVSLMLRGKREVKVSEAAQIARFLGVEVDEVLGRFGAGRVEDRPSAGEEKPRANGSAASSARAGDWEAEFMAKWVELGMILMRKPR